MSDDRGSIRRAYAAIATDEATTANGMDVVEASRSFGYSAEDVACVPADANLGLGCGNPLAIGDPAPGETVLDLGSGAGFDCLLAARRVGPEGRVIGVDLTPEMLDRARRNALEGGFDTIEFRQGDLEDLPVASASVDLVISNCVISLVPDRTRVYREVFRVLRPGGRMAVSDTIVTVPVPERLVTSDHPEVAWLAVSDTPADYEDLVRSAGFTDVRIVDQRPYPPELAFEDALVDELVSAFGISSGDLQRVAQAMLSISLVGHKSP